MQDLPREKGGAAFNEEPEDPGPVDMQDMEGM
jgi:hypothetical protein